MVYLMLATLFRFSVEFLRLNPRILFGLSEAQLLSIIFFFIGLAGFILIGRRQPERSAPRR
jgi:prolipoprotein diacylglyceryltransferase